MKIEVTVEDVYDFVTQLKIDKNDSNKICKILSFYFKVKCGNCGKMVRKDDTCKHRETGKLHCGDCVIGSRHEFV